jgi:hypothetical protein
VDKSTRKLALMSDISKHLPMARAVFVCAMPIAGMVFLQSQMSSIHADPGGRERFVIPMPLYGWIVGAAFILTGIILCVTTFKRGSQIEKIFGAIGALLTVLLLRSYVIVLWISTHG